MNVAWVGLGQMGLPSAIKVAAAGHTVRGFDVNAPAADAAPGIALVGSPREAAKDCDILCIAVFSDSQVADVLTGPEGVINDLKQGAIVAIFTTGSIEAAQEIAANAPAGIAVLDTCFSRSHQDGLDGTMMLLVGGEAEAIERGRPVFDAFTRKIVHVGPSGSGRKIKLVNNILFAGHLQLAADALRMAEALGLETHAAAAALAGGSAGSNMMERFITEDAAPMLETAHRYMIKDVAAAVDAAKNVGVDLGSLGAATALYLTK